MGELMSRKSRAVSPYISSHPPMSTFEKILTGPGSDFGVGTPGLATRRARSSSIFRSLDLSACAYGIHPACVTLACPCLVLAWAMCKMTDRAGLPNFVRAEIIKVCGVISDTSIIHVRKRGARSCVEGVDWKYFLIDKTGHSRKSGPKDGKLS